MVAACQLTQAVNPGHQAANRKPVSNYLYKWDFTYSDGDLRHWPEAPEGPEDFMGGPAESIGYELVERFELGDDEAGFWVLVYERPEERTDLEHEFALELCLGVELRLIFVADLTQLLRALRDFAPIAQAALVSLQVRARREAAEGPIQEFLAAGAPDRPG